MSPTEVILLSMGYLWCVASTTLARQLGTTKILYMLHKDLSGLLRILISYQDSWLCRLCSLIL